MKTALLMVLVVAGLAFPYHKVPHNWPDVFKTKWWRR